MNLYKQLKEKTGPGKVEIENKINKLKRQFEQNFAISIEKSFLFEVIGFKLNSTLKKN